MSLHASVVKPQDLVSKEILFFGLTTVHVEFSHVRDLTSPKRMNLLPGYSRVAQAIAVLLSPQGNTWIAYSPRVGLSPREAMLEVLERVKTLKTALRRKHGEFNIEEDLEEMRNERLLELG